MKVDDFVNECINYINPREEVDSDESESSSDMSTSHTPSQNLDEFFAQDLLDVDLKNKKNCTADDSVDKS